LGRILINVALVIILLLLTFFGMGPVLFADGTSTERMYTLLVVVLLYLLIFAIMFYVNKRMKK
jgi:hypothetical protein